MLCDALCTSSELSKAFIAYAMVSKEDIALSLFPLRMGLIRLCLAEENRMSMESLTIVGERLRIFLASVLLGLGLGD